MAGGCAHLSSNIDYWLQLAWLTCQSGSPSYLLFFAVNWSHDQHPQTKNPCPNGCCCMSQVGNWLVWSHASSYCHQAAKNSWCLSKNIQVQPTCVFMWGGQKGVLEQSICIYGWPKRWDKWVESQGCWQSLYCHFRSEGSIPSSSYQFGEGSSGKMKFILKTKKSWL